MSQSPVIGRSKEFSELKDVYSLAENGKGQLVFISGEGGMGKTRPAAGQARLIAGRACL